MKRIIGIMLLLVLANVMCAEASAANDSTGNIYVRSDSSKLRIMTIGGLNE